MSVAPPPATDASAALTCSLASVCRGESLGATASVVRAFLAVEVPRGWGESALRTSALPAAVRRWLAAAEDVHGARPLLIRRPTTAHAGEPDGVTVLAANPRHGWIETTVVADLDAVASLDVAALGAGSGLGWERIQHPVYLVCTHGKHDPCCAVTGRPVAAALAASGHDAWESSHLGGDRFAANLVALPRGDYLGRLEPVTAVAVMDAYAAGRLPAEHHRGRCTLPWPAQAAERALRERTGDWAAGAVRVARVHREGDATRVELVTDAGAVEALVHRDVLAPQRLTCHAATAEPAPAFRVAFDTDPA